MNNILNLAGSPVSNREALRLRHHIRRANLSNSGAEACRIAMVSTHGYVAANPPLGAADTGGQVVYVLELAKSLAQLGYRVDIWTRRFEDQPETDTVNDRVRIIRVPCGGSGFIPKEYLYRTLDVWLANAVRFIREHGLNYKFINSHYWDGGLAGSGLASALAIPHLHTPHSIGLWKMRQMKTDSAQEHQEFEKLYNFSVRNAQERILYREVDLVIATSPVQLELLAKEFEISQDRLSLVAPGYDDRRFFPLSSASRESIRRRLGFKGKVILALGRLARNKGYDLLIRAFAETIARVPDVSLYLALGGESLSEREMRVLEECRRLVADLGLQDSVTFGGYVPDEELADVYRAADLFALSSRYEPFGMTAVEAMACGTPVIATTHGGLWQTLRFGVDALFADIFDPADFGVTASKALLYPKLADRLSRFGAMCARSRFTWSCVAQHLLAAVDGQPAPSTTAGESFSTMRSESMVEDGLLAGELESRPAAAVAMS